MPRVKIDYVVSFSSEDPEHPANNLLNREVSKKKWLCKKGESSCSVVLQLPRAVKISAVHLGVYHAALVEVLVGRSETSSEQFQVLVPSSVFVSREESRRDSPAERVRSFSAEQLSAAARAQRWDRVRVVCSQPYNKHCQFGLSFVHIDESEGTAPTTVPHRLLVLETFSSDEDDFKPGELFAKHLLNTSAGENQTNSATNTGAQIRQASAQALKNIAESSTKLMKTPINKPNAKRDYTPTNERSVDNSRHTRDHAAGHTHRTTTRHEEHKPSDTIQKPQHEPKPTKSDSPPRLQRNYVKSPTSDQKENKEVRKCRRSNSREQLDIQAGDPVSSLLRGAVLVLSGYEHPRRAAVRDSALALGARVQRDWGPGCTHLICAFPNTPKLRAVRAAAGPRVPVVRAEWLGDCTRRRRLLPWRWYATEPKHLIKPTPEDLVDDTPQPDMRETHQDSDSDGDTDDEIEKFLQKQKKRRRTDSNSSIDKRDDDTTVATIRRGTPTGSRAGDSEHDGTTDEEDGQAGGEAGQAGVAGALPDFFDGFTFVIDAEPPLARDMARYVRAYGGLVLQMSELEEGSEVDYVVHGCGGAGAGGQRSGRTRDVAASWLAGCHAAQMLLPHS